MVTRSREGRQVNGVESPENANPDGPHGVLSLPRRLRVCCGKLLGGEDMDGKSKETPDRAGPVPGRRRWWWGMVLLLAAIPAARVAWQHRPLNAAERRLVGIWKFRVTRGTEPTKEILITLTANRRFMMSAAEDIEPGYGSWSGTGTTLSVRNDGEPWSWAYVRSMANELLARRNPFSETMSYPLELQGDDHIKFGPDPKMADVTAEMTRIGMPFGNEATAADAKP